MVLKTSSILLVFSFLLFATLLLDDVRAEIPNNVFVNDSLIISGLLDSCWINRSQNPTLALEYGEDALQLINDKEIITLKSKALNFVGVVHRKLGHLEEAYNYFKDALNFATLLKDSTQIAYTYSNFTDYFLQKASYSIALENILISYQIFEQLNNKTGMAYCLNYLGEIYIRHGEYEKALAYLQDALKLRDEINDFRGYSNTTTNIGIIYFKLNNFERAFEYFDEALRVNKKIRYPSGHSRILSLKGDIYFSKNEFITAKNITKKALEIDRSIKNKSGQIINLNKLGLIYLKLNNYKLAKESIEKALLLARESGHLDQEMLSDLYLSQYYSSKNLPEKALESLKNYITIKDSIYSDENMGRFADLQTLFVTNRKEIENKLLQKEIELKTRTSQYLLVISIITFIIIFLLVSKFRTQKKTNNLLKELNSSKDKFFSILAHDLKNPFQGLLGYTEMLHTDYDSLTQNEVRDSIESLYSVSRNVYNLLEGLLEWSRAQTGRIEYNPTLFKLSEEARKVVELSNENAVIKEISLSSEIDETVLVFADRNMVSTILRNLVANAIKYTNRGQLVKILAKKKAKEIVITVFDKGIGMSQEELDSIFRIDIHHTTLGTNGEEGTGVGLILCKELVQNNGGKIWAESKLGEGSKFIFTLPSSRN